MKKTPAARPARRRRAAPRKSKAIAAAPVTAAELRALKGEIEKRLGKSATVAVGKQHTAATRKGGAPMRWNPQPEDVQKSVAQLVLTIVEFLRRLMERQAIRRMEQKTLTKKEVEAVGAALMTLEQTVRDIGGKFGLTAEDLNLDLGPLGKLM
ncbi:MAG: putative gas vesicle synthesis protein [Acidobacteria bacterium]|nr:putative gas vesicle synthesis protein [Acidobacteriota bacterium]